MLSLIHILLATDNLHIGIAGNSQSVNKAVAMYGLNNAEKVGKDVSLYLVGDSESDKADLEKAAKAKNVEMHYICLLYTSLRLQYKQVPQR